MNDTEPKQTIIGGEIEYNFILEQERYLEGFDTRCIMQFDDEKFVACVWGVPNRGTEPRGRLLAGLLW